jgi:hypothetical protein
MGGGISIAVSSRGERRGTSAAADPNAAAGRTLLPHGYAAVGEAHPLLARARALAERLGITVPDSATAIDEASLDIDV